MRYILLILFLLFQTLQAKEKVTLQLKWLHQFQFAGYYMAKEKGFFEEEGLDVEIKQRDLKKNNVHQVINGEAQYGVSDSILLFYKANKEPVVIVTPIFQHSPGVILTLKKSKLNSPYELDEKSISFYKKDTDGFAILAMLKSANVTPKLDRVKVKLDYMDLVNEKVDGYAAYLTNEPFYLKKLGIDVNIINPANYGFDFYGDMLFTSQEEVKNYPQRVERFKKATLKGWLYALDNKEEAIKIIKEKYAKEKSIEHLRYEANALEQVIQHNYIPLGTFDKGRIEYTLKKYEEYGLISNKININEFVFAPYNKRIQLTKKEEQWLKNNPNIKLAAIVGHEPFVIKRAENSYNGILVDYIEEISEVIGQKVELEFLENGESTNSSILNNPTILGTTTLFNNPDYKKLFDLSQEYMTSSFEFFINEKDQNKINSILDIEGKSVAILKNNPTILKFLKTIPNVKISYARSHKEQLSMLQYGKVDAVLGYSNYNYLISKMLFDKVIPAFTAKESLSVHMGIKKQNTPFVSILNKAIGKVGEKRKQEIINKWLIRKENQIVLTKKEEQYLSKKKFIKMCVDPDWMPFEKISEGKHIGISAEYMKFLEKEIGTPIKLVLTNNWLQSLEYMKTKECDILSLAMITPSRKEYLNFTKPYIKAPMVIATKIDEPFIGSIETIKDKKIALVRGYAFVEILKSRFPNMPIVEVANIHEGLLKVQNGEVYGIMGALESLGFNIQKDFIGQIKIAGKFDESWQLSIGVRKDEPTLTTIFNKAIDKLPLDKKQEILNKWISINYQKGVNYYIIFQWVASIALIFSIILFIVIKANQKLNREIKQRKTAEQKLQRYINIVDENIITSSTNLKGTIIEASTAFCKTSGYSKEELIGSDHSIVRHKDMPKKIYEKMWEKLLNNEPWEGELMNKDKNGKTYWVNAYIAPTYNENHEKIGYTSIRQNITNKKLLEEISVTDELTKLYNRRHFNKTLPKIINRAKRKDENINFVILDVDYFKLYNDTYGHIKGDAVLKKVAQCIKENFSRADDYCFRLGGEEFGILFKDTSKEKALKMAQKVRACIEGLEIEHEKNSVSAYITASFGVATIKAVEVKEIQTLYKLADELLYKAKEEGRNQVVSN